MAAAQTGGIEIEEDDPVVRELDVYICNEFLGSSTHLCLLQSPLRPPWRPYDYNKIHKARYKPNARRLEMDMPLDTMSRNYSDVIEGEPELSFTVPRFLLLRCSCIQSI